MKRNYRPLTATSLALALAVANAFAQTTPPDEVPVSTAPAAAVPGAKPAALQEVVVIATRRSANLQKVPATIDVVSIDAVTQLNILSVEDMQGVVPGVTIVRNAGSVPFIRGVGTAVVHL